ncbi:malonate decarboxylase holo-ACP synthase [Pseudomonas sp. MAFF 311095]|uniref:Malonate decarboxylase holo-ACP synthase n=1 Tax=Pseudomonas petroselini TaxID=2899822 RepID=A0ABS8R386_9PSED|nr:malonate decarboxylase holo-ACP synthase [Pseudomonas petroselini]MCD7042165.1 malonate decarboxylase holo-ACP synthase [Pseudomonas petroselini]MCD7045031.1 malonate decarboxylase holo-ACP synthase [Pseudomonas petroselini]MCD7067705.1 malonate decarboxylase holo-ACP synthase [Pseudomonas petroselini]MCD7081150.1 malonate decarboxylase holo-ACP synthase [Pseudomonas petroselini]
MVNAHDLLWGMTPAHLPAEAPAWAVEAISAGHPVVVRRAIAAPGYVAVGVRGRLREQRFAAEMPMAAVQRRVIPEALRSVISPRDLPALRALAALRRVLTQETWGVTGSAGFELASGIEALHAQSDLDLILRTPEPLARGDAHDLLAILETAACAVDLQLQTPFGAVALREWASGSRRVLLKTASGAHLVLDPWQAVA